MLKDARCIVCFKKARPPTTVTAASDVQALDSDLSSGDEGSSAPTPNAVVHVTRALAGVGLRDVPRRRAKPPRVLPVLHTLTCGNHAMCTGDLKDYLLKATNATKDDSLHRDSTP